MKTVITDRQWNQYRRLIGDAAKRAFVESVLDKDRIRNLIRNKDKFQSRIIASIKELSASHQFADEEVKSDYSYISGYRKPAKITDQIDILRSHWSNLDPDPALRYIRKMYKHKASHLPNWIEGPFAIIRPGFFSNKYCEELVEVLKAIAKDYKSKFCNHYNGQLSQEHLRQSEHTLSKFLILTERQPESDILILQAQFGIHHRGRSIHLARELFANNEYGLCAKDVGAMLLTNPIRLQHYDDLWVSCAGDEFAQRDGEFSDAPTFSFDNNKVIRFGMEFAYDPHDYYGSASGFLL